MTVALASIRAWWIVRFSSRMTSTHNTTTTSGVIAADVYKQLCISTTHPKQQLMIESLLLILIFRFQNNAIAVPA